MASSAAITDTSAGEEHVPAAVEEGKSDAIAKDEQSQRLSRIRAAAEEFCKRHAHASVFDGDCDLDLGSKLQYSETDEKAIKTGAMLHAFGKNLIMNQKFKDALEVLTMGEEALSLCEDKMIELLDNIPRLQTDIVWCYMMLQDISWLAQAGVRLEKARERLDRSRGNDRPAHLALYLRIELLEAALAYHNGHSKRCKEYLISARAKFSELQVSDEAVSDLISLGIEEEEAKRAVRICSQDVDSAINILKEEKEIIAAKRQGSIPVTANIDESNDDDNNGAPGGGDRDLEMEDDSSSYDGYEVAADDRKTGEMQRLLAGQSSSDATSAAIPSPLVAENIGSSNTTNDNSGDRDLGIEDDRPFDDGYEIAADDIKSGNR